MLRHVRREQEMLLSVYGAPPSGCAGGVAMLAAELDELLGEGALGSKLSYEFEAQCELNGVPGRRPLRQLEAEHPLRVLWQPAELSREHSAPPEQQPEALVAHICASVDENDRETKKAIDQHIEYQTFFAERTPTSSPRKFFKNKKAALEKGSKLLNYDRLSAPRQKLLDEARLLPCEEPGDPELDDRFMLALP